MTTLQHVNTTFTRPGAVRADHRVGVEVPRETVDEHHPHSGAAFRRQVALVVAGRNDDHAVDPALDKGLHKRSFGFRMLVDGTGEHEKRHVVGRRRGIETGRHQGAERPAQRVHGCRCDHGGRRVDIAEPNRFRQPERRRERHLDTITAVVIGGTSLFGGRGILAGSLIGALIVGVFRNGLSLAGIDPNSQGFAVGELIVVAVSIDQWIRRSSK